jgi:MFS family permease
MADLKSPHDSPWRDVTRAQWLVLAIASAGWIFDAFEGQLFNLTRGSLFTDLLHVPASDPEAQMWGERLLGVFLAGGTIGGWLFSSLADKYGRKPVMALTILCYSLFSGLTALTTQLWQVGLLRFLVAMGVGGEWAVGAALVAESFPREARARAGGVFHASSVIGLWLSAAAALVAGSNWRLAYVMGIIPALLVLWVRVGVKEPEKWQHARETHAKELGSFRDLFVDPQWRSHAIFGALLAMVGLATFWGVVVAGQDLAADLLKRLEVPDAEVASKAKIAYGFIQTTGAGLGMLCFGPWSARMGIRRTFALMHVCALVMTCAVCWLPSWAHSYALLLCLLPVFGFFAQGIHAGYAVYFPRLFPTHLRATGAGFCFNTGRILAAPVLFWVSAGLREKLHDVRLAVTILSGCFLMGLVFLVFLPDTRNNELQD